MKQEYSYGAVVYKVENNKILYLVEKSIYGHFGFPKGHIEEGETPLDATKREIKEELNVEPIIDMDFHHTISYSPFEGIMKDVTFYAARLFEPYEVKVQEEEVTEFKWLEYNDVIGILDFQNDLDVIMDANEYIRNKEGIK